MSELLNKQICLALNKSWIALDFRSVKKTIEDVFSLNPETGKPPFVPLDLEFKQNEDGSYDTDVLLSATPVDVSTWISLPVRSCDLGITTGRGEMRVPTIVVATNFSKIKMHRPKFSSDGVWARDNSTCQVTGEMVTHETGDLGHDLARAKGGKRTWSNVGVIKKELNRAMATKSFSEMGWTHVKFAEPKARPVFFTLDDMKHESQKHFLEKN